MKKSVRFTPMMIFKIGICLLPLILAIGYLIATKNNAVMNNIPRAFMKIQPKLMLNFLLVIAASAVMMLGGFRIFLFVRRLFKVNLASEGPLSVFFISFLFGSMLTYIILMTIGVLGLYYTPVVWGFVLLLILFPIGLKEFHTELRALISSVTIKWDVGFILLVSAFAYFSFSLILLQFTTPFPPCIDVMEVYIAPAQRVLNFHRYMPENSMPCAYYNEFRAVPLHTALYAFISVLTGLTSYEAVTGTFMLLLFIFLASGYFLARVLGGRLAGGIAAWLFAGIVHFGYITGARSGIFCMLYFFTGFVYFIKMMLTRDVQRRLFFAVISGIGFGCVTLMHTVVGVFVIFSIFLVFLFSKFWISFKAFWEGGISLIVSAMISSLFLVQLKSTLPMQMYQIVLILLGFFIVSGWCIYLVRTKLMTSSPPEKPNFLGKQLLFPILIFLITVHIIYIFPWKTPFHNESPFMNVFRLSPILFTLGLVALLRYSYIYLFKKTFPPARFKTGLIIIMSACVMLSFATSMYVFPFFKFKGVMEMSFSFEIPGKGLDFFITPFLIALGALVVTKIKIRAVRYAIVTVILAVMTLPTQILLNKIWDGFSELAPRSLVAVTDEQLNWAAYGYFSGWDGDERIPLSKPNFAFIDHLTSLIKKGEITMDDTIIHASKEMHPWIAIPFPVFSGIRQTLILVEYDPQGIFTGFGRLYGFPSYFDYDHPPKWLLIEKGLDYENYRQFADFKRDRYDISFENNRIIFCKLRVL